MDFLTPGIGLMFWMFLAFMVTFFILRKYAWKPILETLDSREKGIEDALSAAERAKAEMEKLSADNKNLLAEARIERDKVLKEAREAAKRINEEATLDASKISGKMIEEAKEVIDNQKNAAMTEVKNLVATLSIEISEKVLRNQLDSDKKQESLITGYLKDLKLN